MINYAISGRAEIRWQHLENKLLNKVSSSFLYTCQLTYLWLCDVLCIKARFFKMHRSYHQNVLHRWQHIHVHRCVYCQIFQWFFVHLKHRLISFVHVITGKKYAQLSSESSEPQPRCSSYSQ